MICNIDTFCSTSLVTRYTESFKGMLVDFLLLSIMGN